MVGTLIGVGVGPGDPQLMTLKAVRAVEAADVILIPVKSEGEDSVAFEIVKEVCDVEGKEILPVIFSMSMKKEERLASRKAAVEKVEAILMTGKTAVMIALGDIGIYSTFMYVKKEVEGKYPVEMIPGIPSFCAGASKALISIVEGRESFCVLPSYKTPDQLVKALKDYPSVIVMKAGSKIQEIYEILQAENRLEGTHMIADCGMPSEYIGKFDPNREYGYFTTLIIKQG